MTSLNFDTEDRATLLDIAKKYSFILDNESIDNIEKKYFKEAWDLITNEFNLHSRLKRSKVQLRSFFEKYKRARLRKLLQAQNKMGKGDAKKDLSTKKCNEIDCKRPMKLTLRNLEVTSIVPERNTVKTPPVNAKSQLSVKRKSSKNLVAQIENSRKFN